jgi:8-oxo-dGTP diphosphatase
MGQNDQGLKSGRPRYQVIPRVLIFIRHEADVLLLKGAPTKRIWANLFNGLGGHVEVGEDILSAARREVLEEAGLEIDNLMLRAVVNIDAGDPAVGILFFAFVGWSPTRHITPSHEGELHWLPVNQLDQVPLVEDLNWLLPRLLTEPDGSGPLFLHYSYDQDDQLVIRPATP